MAAELMNEDDVRAALRGTPYDNESVSLPEPDERAEGKPAWTARTVQTWLAKLTNARIGVSSESKTYR